MKIEEVTEGLKAIGPYVDYTQHEHDRHTWYIRETPSGAQKHAVVLSMSSEAVVELDEEAFQALIEEGKKRYVNGSRIN